MAKNKTKNVYDDDNISEVDLPQSNSKNATKNSSKNSNKNATKNANNSNSSKNCVDPLSESSRPRKDGPGGE